jgi:hypothetical protein
MEHTPWIGVGLDGTLAFYEKWEGAHHIGEPIWPMVERVRQWVQEGRRVKVFTARVADPRTRPQNTLYIQRWLVLECRLPPLEVTNVKDYDMVAQYDDRAWHVVQNQGVILTMPPNEKETEHGG